MPETTSAGLSGPPPLTKPYVPSGNNPYSCSTDMSLRLITASTNLKVGSKHVIGRVRCISFRRGMISPILRIVGLSPASSKLQMISTSPSCSSVMSCNFSTVVNRPVFPFFARPSSCCNSCTSLNGANTCKLALSLLVSGDSDIRGDENASQCLYNVTINTIIDCQKDGQEEMTEILRMLDFRWHCGSHCNRVCRSHHLGCFSLHCSLHQCDSGYLQLAVNLGLESHECPLLPHLPLTHQKYLVLSHSGQHLNLQVCSSRWGSCHVPWSSPYPSHQLHRSAQ